MLFWDTGSQSPEGRAPLPVAAVLPQLLLVSVLAAEHTDAPALICCCVSYLALRCLAGTTPGCHHHFCTPALH